MNIDHSDLATRRQMLTAAVTAGMAAVIPGGVIAAMPSADSPGPQAGNTAKIAPTILDYLSELNTAVQQIATDTWRPDDPRYRADMYQQIMMNLSYAYFAYFHADPEHPDWAPLWNNVYRDQPNPDDVYLYCPIRGDLTYRVSGSRGTCRLVIFTTMSGMVGMTDDRSEIGHLVDIDDRHLQVGPDGELELIFSAERPAGYTGNWARMDVRANTLMIRFVSVDWAKERDPQLSIECLSPVSSKPRLTPEQIVERIKLMAKLPWRYNKMFLGDQNAIKAHVGVNVFSPRRIGGSNADTSIGTDTPKDPGAAAGMLQQVYWPAVYEFSEGEALIIETEMPKVTPYWNIQLNDPYYNAVEFVYRLSSLNEASAKISSDGKLRAVIALEDPGVPNWLDSAGYTEGTIYGRWYNCSSNPTPVIKRVRLAELRQHLPHDTPTVTREQRAAELRERVRASQRRRRW
jgi:hypothetical protein